jgi:hypothetical protein
VRTALRTKEEGEKFVSSTPLQYTTTNYVLQLLLHFFAGSFWSWQLFCFRQPKKLLPWRRLRTCFIFPRPKRKRRRR